jgi:hypothetical protein
MSINIGDNNTFLGNVNLKGESMDKDIEKLKKMRDILKKSADILNELIVVSEKDSPTKEDEEKREDLTGKFLVQLIKIQALGME